MAEAVTHTHVLGDWGTSRLRLFRFEDGSQVDRLEGPGIGKLDGPASSVLLQSLEAWRTLGPIADVTLCGMAGARGGLVEAGYLECPASVEGWRRHRTAFMLDSLPVRVMSGLRCRDKNGVPDVMRGEEAQIFGAMSLDPTLGVGIRTFVLPGTHCKWVSVQDGVVQSFRTYPTGELFALLTERSTLMPRGNDASAHCADGFAHGIKRSRDGTLGALFEARAGQMVDARSPDWARSFLSGLLIGGEIVAEAPFGSQIVLIGDPALCRRYETALSDIGCAIQFLNGDAAALAGLELARGGTA